MLRPCEEVLFWAYATEVLSDNESHAAYDRALTALVNDAAHGEARRQADGLHGWLMPAWVLNHVAPADAANYLQTMDELLEQTLRAAPSHGYDLISGLAGQGIYLLDRLKPRDATETDVSGAAPPSASASAIALAHIVSHLERLAQHDGLNHTTWPRHALESKGEHRETAVCVSHGVVGAVGFLGRLCGTKYASPTARELFDSALAWTTAQWRTRLAAESPIEPVWCRGAAGSVAALAAAVAHAGGKAEALHDVAARCARNSLQRSPLNDVGLCHGTAGIAHMFNRLYQASGDLVLRDTAVAWMTRTLSQRHAHADVSESDIGGFATSFICAEGKETWKGYPNFLSGTVGTGLALLAAISSDVPNWDRLLICDFPAAPIIDSSW
ncbi:MAG: hypothetical protein IPL79_09140 [Myxococcales bacterium]|nr:hypothetical protein [Myxococcales bacterium]